jgi:hypothetical protein
MRAPRQTGAALGADTTGTQLARDREQSAGSGVNASGANPHMANSLDEDQRAPDTQP